MSVVIFNTVAVFSSDKPVGNSRRKMYRTEPCLMLGLIIAIEVRR